MPKLIHPSCTRVKGIALVNRVHVSIVMQLLALLRTALAGNERLAVIISSDVEMGTKRHTSAHPTEAEKESGQGKGAAEGPSIPRATCRVQRGRCI